MQGLHAIHIDELTIISIHIRHITKITPVWVKFLPADREATKPSNNDIKMGLNNDSNDGRDKLHLTKTDGFLLTL